MLTTEERRIELVELVEKMRTAQKEFVLKDQRVAEQKHLIARENAEYYERQVDRALKMLRQRELYDV